MSLALDRQLSLPSRFAVRFIETYRAQVGPELNVRCRFDPTCSGYGLAAYRRYGFLKATIKTLGRLARCRKGHKGTVYDPLD